MLLVVQTYHIELEMLKNYNKINNVIFKHYFNCFT